MAPTLRMTPRLSIPAASGRIVFVDHPLHRRYQDIKAAVGHVYLTDDAPALAYGAALLGRPVLEVGI